MKRKIFEILKAKPTFNRILITADTYTEEECVSDTGMIKKDSVGVLKEIQTVLAVGESVRNCKVGDKVVVDYSPYQKRKFTKDSTKDDMPDEYYNPIISFEVPTYQIDGKLVLRITDNDIPLVIEEFNESECEVATEVPEKKLV